MRDPKLQNVLDQARYLGTLNQIDRSTQYQDDSTRALLKSNNHQWVHIRRFERQRFRHALILLGIAWLPHILKFLCEHFGR